MGNPRKILIAGATGLIGQRILSYALSDNAIGEVHVLCRRPLGIQDAKLTEHVVDFTELPTLPRVSEVYLAVGTTIKQAGSQEVFRHVDYDINLDVAQAALAAGASRIGLVSAMGADPNSRIFYHQIKGDLEAALTELNPLRLVIARPSLLMGNRAELKQPIRPGEFIGKVAGTVLRPFIPKNYRPIQSFKVALALLDNVPIQQGKVILSSGEMQ